MLGVFVLLQIDQRQPRFFDLVDGSTTLTGAAHSCCGSSATSCFKFWRYSNLG